MRDFTRSKSGCWTASQRHRISTAPNIDDVVLFVDVAGGLGRYTEALLAKFPGIPGRLILQDLPPVIESIQELHPRIERMEYDFFTEQPIKC